jgi:hypothetical protein
VGDVDADLGHHRHRSGIDLDPRFGSPDQAIARSPARCWNQPSAIWLRPASQPTVSHHTKVLAEAGLITGEKRGRWVWWSLVPDRVSDLRDALKVGATGALDPV